MKQNEIAGVGNHYQFKFREYDPRIGKFWSEDPLFKKYPSIASYTFAEDRVIDGMDLEGAEFYSVHMNEDPSGKRTVTYIVNYTNIPQQGMINSPTKDGYGERGDVGVTYTITKVDKDGKAISKTGFNVKNIYGVYQGGNNPKKYWQKPGPDGEYPDDYTMSPIDETDANAKQHDKDYDAAHIKGAGGVFGGVEGDKGAIANKDYIDRANKTIAKQKRGEKDDITGKPVTKAAANNAKQGKMLFKIANGAKPRPGYGGVK